jgi:hypothetical protein
MVSFGGREVLLENIKEAQWKRINYQVKKIYMKYK